MIGLYLAALGIEFLFVRYFGSSIPILERTVLTILTWALGILGFFIFMSYLIRFATTKVALTDKRILIRRNLIFVNVDEVDLEEIKSAHVNNGLLGRFLDYGEIHYDARFVGDIALPDIDGPYLLLRKTHEARTLLDESLSVLSQHTGPSNQKRARSATG